MQEIMFSCYSGIGLIRQNNEDNLYCCGVTMTELTRNKTFLLDGVAQSPCIFAVCDGMGGEAHGELASLTAVNVLHEHSEKIKSAALLSEAKKIDEAVQAFVSVANNRLCSIMRKNSFRMGTTLALAVISDKFIRAYNIGDSRIYKFQDKMLSLISEDHTIAQQKIKMGLITPEEARHDKSRHVLTRCLGVFEDEMILTPNILPPLVIDKRIRLLLCSDGLTDMISDSQIQKFMLENKDTSSAVDMLVNQALKNGGRDNITCIMIDIFPKENENSD